MGFSPLEFLVLPRVIALILMMPLLCFYSDFLGILGGAVIGVGMLDLSWTTYFRETMNAISLSDVFGGVFKVLIPDNASAIVADADPVNPRFTAGWLDYAQHCGFATDAARVRSPKDKPKVERAVQYVRGNFFAGEQFAGLGRNPVR